MRELYNSLVHGDPQTPRVVPFDLAQKYGLFGNEVALLIQQAAEKTRQAREEFQKKYFEKRWHTYCNYYRKSEEDRFKREFSVPLAVHYQEMHLASYMSTAYSLTPPNMYVSYVWLQSYPDLQSLLAPCYTTRSIGYTTYRGKNINRLIGLISECLRPDTGDIMWYSEEAKAWCGESIRSYRQFWKKSVVKKLIQFLETYKGAAIATLELLNTARFGRRHWNFTTYYPSTPRMYPNTCMADFPVPAGIEPLELLHLVKQLNEVMLSKQQDYAKFLNSFIEYFERKVHTLSVFRWKRPTDVLLKDLERDGGPYLSTLRVSPFTLDVEEKRPEVRRLKTALKDRWEWFATQYPTAASQWLQCDELTRLYLLTRSCDLVYYGEHIAHKAFPQPTFAGAQEIVSALVWLLEDRENTARLTSLAKVNEGLTVLDAKEHKRIEQACAKEIAKISCSPAYLTPRVLSADERDQLIKACLGELRQSGK